MLRKRISAVLLLASMLVAGRAHAVFIDFESVPGVTAMTPFVAGTPVPASSQLTTQLQFANGVSFSSTPGYAALVNLGEDQATSGTNGIGGVSAGGTLDYRVLLIVFSVPGDPSTPAVTSFVSIRGDMIAMPDSAMLEVFDADGGLLASATAGDTGGVTLSLAVPGIHSLRVTSTSGTIAFDDLQFNDPTAVPEPATLALLGVGLTLLASTRWR